MKNTFIKCSILLMGTIFFSCDKEEPASGINLTGTWIGEGYMCLGTIHSETIKITHERSTGNVVATKITGDNCVLAGMVTFRGVYDGKASEFSAVFTTGTPNAPGSSQSTSKIIVKNEELMQGSFENIVFKKQ